MTPLQRSCRCLKAGQALNLAMWGAAADRSEVGIASHSNVSTCSRHEATGLFLASVLDFGQTLTLCGGLFLASVLDFGQTLTLRGGLHCSVPVCTTRLQPRFRALLARCSHRYQCQGLQMSGPLMLGTKYTCFDKLAYAWCAACYTLAHQLGDDSRQSLSAMLWVSQE